MDTNAADSQNNKALDLCEAVVNALADSCVGTIQHKALLSFNTSVKRHGLTSVGVDEVRLWIVDMILNGLRLSTMKAYFNRMHVVCQGWYDFSESDPFEIARADLYRDYNLHLDETSDNLNRLKPILENSKSQDSETRDMFLYLLYDVNSEVKDLIEFRFDDASRKLQQIEDIADRYKGEKRTKYVFGLQQGQIRESQSTTKIKARIARMLNDEGMKCGNAFTRDTIKELWIAAALNCGITTTEIRGVVNTLPAGYSLLEIVKPKDLSDIRKNEILKKVADHINDNKKYWYAMQMRTGITPDDIKKKLKDKQYHLLDEVRFYYPVHKVQKERANKKIKKEEVPYIPRVLFFYLRRNDVADLFRKYIGDEAWCYRYVNRTDCPYSAISRDEMQRFQRYIGEFTEDILMEMNSQEKPLSVDDLVTVYGGVMDGSICKITEVKGQHGRRKYSLVLAENVAIQWTVKDIDSSRIEPLTETQKRQLAENM